MSSDNGKAKMTASPGDIRKNEERRAEVLTSTKNQVYRTLVSLVGALGRVCPGGPREAIDLIRGELDALTRDLERSEKKAAKKADKK